MALARALAIEPRVLLLDEPFGALDAQVRKELRRWLREIHDQTGHTTVFVTHDQEEALELADRVVVMSQGTIEQVGTRRRRLRPPELALRLRLHRRFELAAGQGREWRAVGRRPRHRPCRRATSAMARRCSISARTTSICSMAVAAASPARSPSSRRVAGTRRVELEIGGNREKVEIELPIDHPAAQKSRVAFRPKKWKLFPVS